MNLHRHTKLKALAAAITCGAVGAAAGIAGSAAAPSNGAATGRHAMPPWHLGPGGSGPGRHFGDGPAVHEEGVVLNRARTAFVTVTSDSGTLRTVSGASLTVQEGVGKLTYKTVTLAVPSGATVIRNFQKATLTELKAGDRVHVRQSPDGTEVVAEDAAHLPPPHPVPDSGGPPPSHGLFRGHGIPGPGAFGPRGPPPGAP